MTPASCSQIVYAVLRTLREQALAAATGLVFILSCNLIVQLPTRNWRRQPNKFTILPPREFENSAPASYFRLLMLA